MRRTLRRCLLGLALLAAVSPTAALASRWLEVVSEHGSEIAQATTHRGDNLVLLATVTLEEVGLLSLDADGVPLSGIGLSVAGEATHLAGAIAPTSDGGLVVTTILGPNPVEDAVVIRLDASGNVVWQTRLTAPGDNTLASILEAPDGDIVGVGAIQLGTSELRSSAWMVRLTPSGAQRWSIALSGPGDTVLDDVTVADGGDVIAVGWAGSSKGLDALAARVDAQGRVVWQTAMGAKDDESAEAVTRLAAGDYALVGNTAVFTTVPNCRPFLARFDGSGTVAWQKTVDAPAETCVAVTDVAPSSTGGFAWAGFDTSPFEQGTIQAVDETGAPLWKRTFLDAQRLNGLEALPTGYLVGGYFGGGSVAAALGADGLVDASCPNVVSTVPMAQAFRPKAQRAHLTVSPGPSTAAGIAVTVRPMALNTFDLCRVAGAR